MKTKKGFMFFMDIPFEERKHYLLGREGYAISIEIHDYITQEGFICERKRRNIKGQK